ncbi:hypothetical protein [Pseudooceanicola nitratireducens]|jgi:hypothetical protein|uniref:hypothetical protein n=1 Tax=Pseudooceanicola nitratireducens TaxID=517719 RepID=UPI003C7DE56B
MGFQIAPLFIKEEDVAKMLGHNVRWLRERSTLLEDQYGFPKIDPATRMRHREAVEAWARERNMRPSHSHATRKGANLNEV